MASPQTIMSNPGLGFNLVVPPTRSVALGGERLTRERLLVEMSTQSLADVRALVRTITVEEVAQQTAINNPPSVVEIDSGQTQTLADVDRRVVVLFGVVLVQAAMREVEDALRDAIDQSTTARSGTLHNLAAGWQWRYIPVGGAARVVTSSEALPAFGPGDKLVLRPQNVPYATTVNTLVAHSGRLNPVARLVKGKRREPPKSRQNRGFLFVAADKLRRRPAFKQFRVRVVYSEAYPVPQETTRKHHASGMIVITARANAGSL
jgi:hypothetical protein